MRRGRKFLTWLMVFLFLDVCTTILGLSTGLREANPVLSSLMHVTGLQGLLISKAIAVALALYFLYTGRVLLLRRVTMLMGLVVCWNILWLVAH